MEKHKKCSVRILSETDGKKNVFSSLGEIYLATSGEKVCYRQGNSLATLQTQNGEVLVAREGEVYLRFRFSLGEVTQGVVGISAQNKGKVDVYTQKLNVIRTAKNNKKSLTITLQYSLVFSSKEKQNVLLRFFAEYEDE